jgi:Mn-containing catalase
VFLHNKQMMYTVRVGTPDAKFGKLLLEQFGGPNGELAAALRYFTQGWNDPNGARRDMLLDIATEELSHLEMVGQTISMLLADAPARDADALEGSTLGRLMDGDGREPYFDLALGSSTNVVGGGKPRLTDSSGTPFTAAYIDTIGEPTADLRSNVAAEARAKIVYERLIKFTDDAEVKDTLTFLMTREIAHQKMFEAALAQVEPNFPPGKLPGDEKQAHLYYDDSTEDGEAGSSATSGFDLAKTSPDWSFELADRPS